MYQTRLEQSAITTCGRNKDGVEMRTLTNKKKETDRDSCNYVSKQYTYCFFGGVYTNTGKSFIPVRLIDFITRLNRRSHFGTKKLY